MLEWVRNNFILSVTFPSYDILPLRRFRPLDHQGLYKKQIVAWPRSRIWNMPFMIQRSWVRDPVVMNLKAFCLSQTNTKTYDIKYFIAELTKISEVNLFVFIYRLFHKDLSSIIRTNTVLLLTSKRHTYHIPCSIFGCVSFAPKFWQDNAGIIYYCFFMKQGLKNSILSLFSPEQS